MFKLDQYLTISGTSFAYIMDVRFPGKISIQYKPKELCSRYQKHVKSWQSFC